MFATCSWPSLCKQSELQCFAATDDCADQRNLHREGAVANLQFPNYKPPTLKTVRNQKKIRYKR